MVAIKQKPITDTAKIRNKASKYTTKKNDLATKED
jgi:hypothetical protein